MMSSWKIYRCLYKEIHRDAAQSHGMIMNLWSQFYANLNLKTWILFLIIFKLLKYWRCYAFKEMLSSKQQFASSPRTMKSCDTSYEAIDINIFRGELFIRTISDKKYHQNVFFTVSKYRTPSYEFKVSELQIYFNAIQGQSFVSVDDI